MAAVSRGIRLSDRLFFLEFKHKLGPEVAACQVDVLL